MSSEIPCPYCGAPLPEGHPIEASGAEPATVLKKAIAPVGLLASGSNDDSFIAPPPGQKPPAAEPDPILGEFVSPSTSRADAVDGSGSATPAPSRDFPALNLDGLEMAGPARGRADSEEDDPAEEDMPGRRRSWSTVLLGSYASAMTLALAWTLYHPRVIDRGEPGPPPSAGVAPPASGHQAPLSRKVETPEPIVGDHMTTLGKPLRVGMLEITPVDVSRQDVALEKKNLTGGQPRHRDGGQGAMVLRLRLRNTSADAVFAPLDQSYIRERGKEVVDTFVETPDGGRIYPFPLAVESEWSIAGQDFGELRPGESREVPIVTAPDAPGNDSGPFTWRVRLRTGIGRTDVIGVRWPEGTAAPSGPSTGKG